MSHFVTYALHYVILRTLYTGARGLGVSPWLMLGVAVVLLVTFWVAGGRELERRRWRRRARWQQEARQEARERARERSSL